MSTDEKRQPEEDEDDAEWEEFEAPVPPDGGWGWVVMISSFLSNVIVDGVCYTYTIYYNELLDYFGASRGKTALVGALLPACYLLVGKTMHIHALQQSTQWVSGSWVRWVNKCEWVTGQYCKTLDP